MNSSGKPPATPQKRTFLQIAVHNFFALYLGVTPPAPGQEYFYGLLIVAVLAFLVGVGYLIVHVLLGLMLH
jgi:hypothetical protein